MHTRPLLLCAETEDINSSFQTSGLWEQNIRSFEFRLSERQTVINQDRDPAILAQSVLDDDRSRRAGRVECGERLVRSDLHEAECNTTVTL